MPTDGFNRRFDLQNSESIFMETSNKKALELSADSLTAETRSSRKSLILLTTLGIVMSLAGITPNKISLFGIEFPNLSASFLLWILVAFLSFMLTAFVMYAFPNYLRYRYYRDEFQRKFASEDLDSRIPPGEEEYDALTMETDYRPDHAPMRWGLKAARLRTLFDFALPILYGALGLVILVGHALQSK